MRTLSFRISQQNYERLMQLSNKWNREDRKIPECDPWTMSDIINSCICLQWEREFVLGIGSELKDDVKENINE